MSKRRTWDEQGNPIVEVKTRDGVYVPEVDDRTLRDLNAMGLTLADTAARKRPDFMPPPHVKVGSNPYDGGSVAAAKKLKRRNSLDFLRALSEEIKKRRGNGSSDE